MRATHANRVRVVAARLVLVRLTLKSFHLFFIAISIVLTAGVGMWGLLNYYQVLGAFSLLLSVLLVGYGGYFAAKAQRVHLE